jgi:hypothetical protein
MKTLFTLLLTICIMAGDVTGQAVSSLIKIGENGKLEYIPFANNGETNAVNTIPDFSFAGYKYGGVEIPEAHVALTLSPLPGDNHQQIQDAINTVAAMPINENGFRGAILFEPGIYTVDAPLVVNASGIVLRGSGQMPGDQGGTELIANARYQHNFITFSGTTSGGAAAGFLLDTIIFPKAIIPNEDDGKIWLSADVKAGVEQEYAGDKVITMHITAENLDDFASIASKESTDETIHPYMELTLFLNQMEKDTIIFIKPTDDAFIQGGEYANDNYGSNATLPIKNRGINNRVTREIFMKFELPDYDAEVVAAELYVYCTNAPNEHDMLTFVTLIANDDWSESTITYTNQPTQASSALITSDYVPSGATKFTVSSATDYKVGDKIVVLRTPNQAWIDLLNMGQYGWDPGSYRVSYERTIVAISGNKITINIPLVQAIAKQYGGGEMFLNPIQERTNHCGVENMFISSYYASETDEDHGWTAISLRNVEDSWVKNVTGRYFGYGLVNISGSSRITVQDSAMLDPKSITTGGRKYSFNIASGSFILFQRLYTRGGRHDYATGSRVAGPNVFVDCVSEQTFSDIGPHHRYATGTLFDNILGGQTRVWNRGASGTGHGWAGAQTMFWNIQAPVHEIKVDSPPNAMNWGIGCIGGQRTGAGFWEKWSMNVLPRSLYYQQLQDRLGEEAVLNTTIPVQHSGRIYDAVKNWKGFGPLTEYLPSNNSNLADLKINDETVSAFHPNRVTYDVEVVGTGIPQIDAIPYFESSVIDITQTDEDIPGSATIEVTAEDGVTKRTYTINYILSTTSIREWEKGIFTLYPNPAGNFIVLGMPESAASDLIINIYNLTGHRLLQQAISANNSRIDTDMLLPGVYFISIHDGVGIKETKRFVKQ